MDKSKELKKIIRYSVMLIMFVLIYNSFSIYIEYFLGDFMVMFLFISASLLVALMVFSFIKVYSDKEYRYAAYMIASIIVLTLFFTHTLRFIGINIDYRVNKTQRWNVVQMLKDGSIPYSSSQRYVELPPQYSYLSRYNGSVMIDDSTDSYKVCFFVSGGANTNCDVIVFVSDDQNLRRVEFGDMVKNVKKVEKCWYSAKILE